MVNMICKMTVVLGISFLVIYLLFGHINLGGVIGASIGCVYAFHRFREEENEEEQG